MLGSTPVLVHLHKRTRISHTLEQFAIVSCAESIPCNKKRLKRSSKLLEQQNRSLYKFCCD